MNITIKNVERGSEAFNKLLAYLDGEEIQYSTKSNSEQSVQESDTSKAQSEIQTSTTQTNFFDRDDVRAIVDTQTQLNEGKGEKVYRWIPASERLPEANSQVFWNRGELCPVWATCETLPGGTFFTTIDPSGEEESEHIDFDWEWLEEITTESGTVSSAPTPCTHPVTYGFNQLYDKCRDCRALLSDSAPTPSSSQQVVSELGQLFDDNFNCYADSDSVIPAMTKECFIQFAAEYASIQRTQQGYSAEAVDLIPFAMYLTGHGNESILRMYCDWKAYKK